MPGVSENMDLSEVVDDREQHIAQQQTFLDHTQTTSPRWAEEPLPRVPVFSKIMPAANALLFLVLVMSIALVAQSTTSACGAFVGRLSDPYCKLAIDLNIISY